MHPLVNRSLQCFLRDTYGEPVWRETASAAGVSIAELDAILYAEPSITRTLLHAAARRLGKHADTLLEDMGTYLVSHANSERVRRLLRFSGESFEEFLFSLEDLPDRVRLAVGDLHLPALQLVDLGEGQFELHVDEEERAYGIVLCGLLRAMADDYGALVLLDCPPMDRARDDSRHPFVRVTVHILDQAFSQGRRFDLAAPDALAKGAVAR